MNEKTVVETVSGSGSWSWLVYARRFSLSFHNRRVSFLCCWRLSPSYKIGDHFLNYVDKIKGLGVFAAMHLARWTAQKKISSVGSTLMITLLCLPSFWYTLVCVGQYLKMPIYFIQQTQPQYKILKKCKMGNQICQKHWQTTRHQWGTDNP